MRRFRPLRPLSVLAALSILLGLGLAPGHAAAAPAPAPAAKILSATPYQGWNTYYGLGGDFTAAQVLDVADSLVDRGLAKAGYDIVWLDGGWQAADPRGADGRLRPDPTRFPNGLEALTDALHAKGLRAGIYTDAGPYIPGRCGLGSGGHYQTDADTFAGWGFDAVKVDYLCGIAADLDPQTVFTEFAHAIANNASHRPMVFNLCNPVTSPDWGDYPESQQSTHSWTYAPKIAQSWRTYTDVGFVGSIKYTDVLRNFDQNAKHPEAAGPGHWNDPDYLGPELGMTDEEFRSQFALWAMSAAPLMVASDVRSLSATSVATLTNPRLLAIDQDRLGRQAVRVGGAGDLETWVKPLADGSRAVLLLNRGDTASDVRTTAAKVGLRGSRFAVTDAWSGARTESGPTLRASVPAHGTAVLRVARAHHLPATPRLVVSAPTAAEGATLTEPGGSLRVTVKVHNDGTTKSVAHRVSLVLPAGWGSTRRGSLPATLRPGAAATVRFDVTVADRAKVGPEPVSAQVRFLGVGGYATSRSAPLAVTVAPTAPTGSSALSHHDWVSATSGWMTPAVDQSVGGGPIVVAGTTYATGIGVASPSTIRYYLGAACTRLTGAVGIDDAVKNVGPEGGTATFSVVGDGRTLFSSDTVVRDQLLPFDVDVSGVRDLRLLVGDAGDGGYNDRADWTGLAASCR